VSPHRLAGAQVVAGDDLVVTTLLFAVLSLLTRKRGGKVDTTAVAFAGMSGSTGKGI